MKPIITALTLIFFQSILFSQSDDRIQELIKLEQSQEGPQSRGSGGGEGESAPTVVLPLLRETDEQSGLFSL